MTARLQRSLRVSRASDISASLQPHHALLHTRHPSTISPQVSPPRPLIPTPRSQCLPGSQLGLLPSACIRPAPLNPNPTSLCIQARLAGWMAQVQGQTWNALRIRNKEVVWGFRADLGWALIWGSGLEIEMGLGQSWTWAKQSPALSPTGLTRSCSIPLRSPQGA